MTCIRYCPTFAADMTNTKNLNHYGTLEQLFKGSVSSFKENTLAAFADGEGALTFEELAQKCEQMDRLLRSWGVSVGDRVAILSENMPNWIVAFFTATAYGRVVVPILPDCSANEVANILNHSQSKAVFVSAKQKEKLSQCSLQADILEIDMENLDAVLMGTCPVFFEEPRPDIHPSDLAAIIYTSGTSGNAKGVMLSHLNLCHNIVSARGVETAYASDVWLSVLPMGHTFEMSLGMLYPFAVGASIYYLRKSPTPAVLMKAMADVRPTIMMSVPLIIEKVYRNAVLKQINASGLLRFVRAVAPAFLYRKIGRMLIKKFGGRIRFFGIGGAKLDSEVEAFLNKAGFPYAIGYGMTECAPLICAATVGHTRVGSTGGAVAGMQVRLNDVNEATGEGEIVVKGPNVMMGYYKDEARTSQVFTADGWLRTNDLAVMSENGYFDIKGRLGNMILGASGENIYPEEIEMVIAGVPFVEESLVKSENGKLVALVRLSDGRVAGDHEARRILTSVNPMLNKASQLAEIRFVQEEFQKTATRKIRRFLYA